MHLLQVPVAACLLLTLSIAVAVAYVLLILPPVVLTAYHPMQAVTCHLTLPAEIMVCPLFTLLAVLVD